MSKSEYKWNTFRIYTVEYSFTLGGKPQGGRRASYSQSEEGALAETRDSVFWSGRDDFEARVVSYVEYSKNGIKTVAK